MGGPSCQSWQELAEQPPQPSEGYGKACDMIVALREQIGSMKKQLSNLALPMKTYIYSTDAPDRTALQRALSSVDDAAAAIGAAAVAAAEAAAAADAPDRTALQRALSSVDDAAAAIGAAAVAAAEAAAADACIPAEVKAEAAKVLGALRSDITQQSADSRALCLVTADKADAHAARSQQQQPEQQQQEEQQQQQGGPGFAKELYETPTQPGASSSSQSSSSRKSSSSRGDQGLRRSYMATSTCSWGP
ncbi:uncharacterized protein EMH_0063680 [Eimeria mitis]|uniref:Uncharacterized protein n=1 Tax=Eimeria mitis TaxID=44415 RepID=U6KCJ1_9EIME|nr:uncharacterized protein EMH_0063680 [Eimeria mitis]CDJ34501.1 hypothetical protein, conserved [Eimeria mitis]